jgi:trans-aconitate methyltransferase
VKSYWQDRYNKLLDNGVCGMMTLEPNKRQLNFLDKIKFHLKNKNFQRVTDFGCGSGKCTDFLIEQFHPTTYIGYDFIEDAVNYASKKHEQTEGAVFIYYEGEIFETDILWTSFVLQHIKTAQLNKLLKLFCNKLSENGIFYAVECTQELKNTDTIYFRSTLKYQDMFIDAGFKNVHVLNKLTLNGNEVSLFEVTK